MRSGRYFEVTSDQSCSHLAFFPRTSAAMKLPFSTDPLPKRISGRSPVTTIALTWLQ